VKRTTKFIGLRYHVIALVIALTGIFGCTDPDPEAAFRAGDYETSFKQWLERAEKGDVKAQNYVAIHYHMGLAIKQDHKAAVEWYQRAARAGNADAQRNLGTMYQLGLGVAQDRLRAYAWYYAAAERGHPKARDYLKLMANQLTPNQIAQAKRLLAEELVDRKAGDS
jgi:TPR repeat protein